jgi:hypothetical protein
MPDTSGKGNDEKQKSRCVPTSSLLIMRCVDVSIPQNQSWLAIRSSLNLIEKIRILCQTFKIMMQSSGTPALKEGGGGSSKII